jgi:hydrogenase maturation protein HypF
MPSSPPVATRILLSGRVQGVGFRPAAWRLARAEGLAGSVRNTPRGAELLLACNEEESRAFIARLAAALPSPGEILSAEYAPAAGEALPEPFAILPSASEGVPAARLLPDLAVCGDCLRELFDPRDRRFRYPFLNCTRCGPRYSILRRLPYDRANTSMAAFPLCPACREEYESPGNRRFHAQPVACPACGPQLAFFAVENGVPRLRARREDALQEAEALLRSGGIVAVKGLGGFQLCCDARDETAVRRLRERKRRPAKPFAVMFPAMDDLKNTCEVSAAEEAALRDPSAPIVLLEKTGGTALAPSLAPHLATLGAFLPTTPLHALLLHDLGFPVVATSGNLSEEPIAIEDADAFARLGGIADAFLTHDRPILRPMDDSVVFVHRGQPVAVRRARGLSPYTFPVPGLAAGTLAAGGDLKGAIALSAEGEAVLSQHLGDWENPLVRENARRAAEDLARLKNVTLSRAACDAARSYFSSQAIKDKFPDTISIRHHRAHAASLLAEAGERNACVLVWDGTGEGDDGTSWGSETFDVRDGNHFRLASHLRPFPLLGGDAAAREPKRCAFALLREAGLPAPEGIEAGTAAVWEKMRTSGINTIRGRGMGRLFDGVAAMLGFAPEGAQYEGEAASRLEAAATAFLQMHALPAPYPFSWEKGADGTEEADWREMVRALAAAEDPAEAAARFHATLAALAAEAARRADAPGVVGLTGGCFQNRLLLELVQRELERNGFRVLLPRDLPPNDAGLALGQLLLASRT